MHDQGAERAVAIAVIVVAASVGLLLVSVHTDGPDVREAAVVSPMVAATAPTTIPSGTTSPGGAPATTAPAPAGRASAASTTTPSVDPGSLPQTEDKPVGSGTAFDAGVQGLWNAIVRDDPSLAMPFFFPKSAYLQVKAIPDPASDYENRLIANYEQDIHALHAQLGADASTAHFDGIDVPDADAVWVQPGEESNKLSYWRVYGTQLRYTLAGVAGTMPVTSLISWRGEWYVVHLGAIR
jgi:hypothetical protein